MDFPLSSSVILVVAVVLWIVWVAPYVLRNRRSQFLPAGEMPVDTPHEELPDPTAGLALNVAARQEKAMDTRKSAGPGAGAPPTGQFRIRYGRTALALGGLLALLTAFVSGVLLPFGVGSPALPLSCLALTVLAAVVLRRLALRDRAARVEAAFRDAMGPAPHRAEPASRPATPDAGPAPREDPPFDAEADSGATKPLTAAELREAALAVAVAAGDASAIIAPAGPANTPWEPVEVPKPVYVEAAKAERPAPAPLELPEAPKAAGKPSLRQGAEAQASAADAAQPAKAQGALGNLDDVLQRRRA
ncbi:hypothetical protein ACRB8A_13315 [Arthrobacter sp. G.S.26]|uniref:hypothetical protein n=1 Tax=Arthrobacter sp. G.S.26 TaxID=3433706 RepID=UPI003D775A1E